MKFEDLSSFLDEKADLYNNPKFIESDPIQVPHRFSQKEDIEIAGFLSATIAWGNRKSIITNASRMMELMGNSPYDFVLSHTPDDLARLDGFVHRTFNSHDFSTFISGLRNLYRNHGGLENAFSSDMNLQIAISHFRTKFFEIPHQQRTQKHLSDPLKNSAAKRINMFLRWMVRKDNKGVDFGIWDSISPSALSCPLDIHSGNVARKLGLLKRSQNDGKALAELDASLRKLDALDPVKYDFALFGLGVFEGF
ncbi:TIGR02757 family protein [Flavobacterium silvaticum]|uniref:TIGR02757 family protein n=1 Tax=Flavobacterium silvaticum TaxID=1852020 RepID=A0A972FJG1_9FLAO|nr:TIGR02757 family protein [Flavobacterium silvaticum]NMH26792.1 TIGR02757 family protein [Flavobacterium silvaticum]